jgi:hypothetical protein
LVFYGTDKKIGRNKRTCKTDPRVIDIQYSEIVDLIEVINTMFTQSDWSDFNIDTHNLEITFDLNDENGSAIINELGDDEADQQRFINLEGSQVTTLVYEIEGRNPPAVDRTPIVHVMLKSKDSNFECKIIEGFIKLNIIEDGVVPVPSVLFPTEDGVMAGCSEFVITIDAAQMNESFYTKAQLSKDVFHNYYSWSTDSEGTGTVTEVEDPADPDSYNLIWTVSVDELWNNISATIEKIGYYTYNEHVIKVTFTAEVIQPAADLSELLLDGVWFGNHTYIIHDVATPEINLNDAFTTTSEKLLDLASANTAYSGYLYEYVFDENQPLEAVDDIVISVSSDGKKLLANDEIVVTIKPQTAAIGDILAFNEESALAALLLDKEVLRARIKLVVTNGCNRPLLIDAFNGEGSFLVHFEEEDVPVNLIVNGNFEDDFEPSRKPASVIFSQTIGYAEPARIAKYFNSKTEPYWPKIDDATTPTFDTENGIWYLVNSDNWSYTRLYIDERKNTPYGDKAFTLHNTGVNHNEEARSRGAHTPFQYLSAQRVSLDNNRSYTLSFSYLRVDGLVGPSGSTVSNHVTRFVAGIVSSTDTTVPLEATFSIDVPIPAEGDETWKDFEVTFDLPALIANNPGLDFSTSAIIFGIQTKENPSATTAHSMLPGQMSIDNVSLMRKK